MTFEEFLAFRDVRIKHKAHEKIVRMFYPYLASVSGNARLLPDMLGGLLGLDFSSVSVTGGCFNGAPDGIAPPYDDVDFFIRLSNGLLVFVYGNVPAGASAELSDGEYVLFISAKNMNGRVCEKSERHFYLMENNMNIREAHPNDLTALLYLYTHLHETGAEPTPALCEAWDKIMSDPNHHILVGTAGGETVSSCVVVVVHNLTRGGRPYALVENMVTHSAHRQRGYATALLQRARELAAAENCYKIMLMTGSKAPETLRFYQKAGFNMEDKTAFICWLD